MPKAEESCAMSSTSASDVPPGVPWRSIRYQSTDGAEIQAWLATPPGNGPFPTIVHTHGGPTAVQTNIWKPDAQAWLDHGPFAFFSLNYRGSITFGYDFQHAIDGNLGDLEVEDVAAGVQWLLDNGIARPGAILKTGGSYGGYLTLQSLGKKPDLFAGGMAIVAIADLDADVRGSGRHPARLSTQHVRRQPRRKTGSPSQSLAHHLRRKHPSAHPRPARRERYPLPAARQMKVYEKRLKELGKSIDIYWFDAGHGSLAVEEQIKHQELMLEFAYQTLG